MIKRCKLFSLLLAMIVMFNNVQSQATKAYTDPDEDFKLAKELYQKEQFSLAYPLFRTLWLNNNTYSNVPISIQVEAKYYSIVSGLQLNDATAVEPARAFIDLEHNRPKAQVMSFHLAEYYFRKQNFSEAQEYYNRADVSNLSNRQIADMKFHQAYTYFGAQRFNEAKPLFDAIRQIPSDPNYIDANYYYGFISFYDKNYRQALESFRVVENQPTYQKIVPYYIAEIYYFNGEKDKAIQYAEDALKKGGQYYEIEMKQLIGHAYFEKKEFAKALPYLEEYVSKSAKVRREDLYELAYSYYSAGQYQKAITSLKELGGKEDSLAQNSMYLLADAYLKTGQKANARSAFLFGAQNNSNQFQREVSRFHYAKLSYELGYNDIALNEFQSFTRDYPNSTFQQEARELLVASLANGNNYQDALNLFQSLSTQSENVKRVYPRVLYGRAVELINDQQLRQAEELLDRLLSSPYNTSLIPFANFWKGEIAYRTSRNDEAIAYLNKYISNPLSNEEVNLVNARYTLGYAYMKNAEYRLALTQFEQITKTVSASSPAVEQDAYLRSADVNFMEKRFSQALSMYENVMRFGLPNSDYALFQKAIISGAANRSKEKVQLLESLEQRYPTSRLIPDAQLEIANTYLAEENFRESIDPLNRLLRNKNAESLFPQGYLKLGVAHFNLNNNPQALEAFKRLVSGYPNSEESDQAIEYVRSIFVENGQPGEFVTFMKTNGKNITYSEEDSLTYASAQIQLQNKNTENALRSLEDYLRKFPDGKYAIDANFFAADIYNTKKDYANAFTYYSNVAAKAPNKYAEQSILQAARISYFELKDYVKAEQFFTQLRTAATTTDNKLEAMRGLLRVQYKLNKWTEAVPNAQDLLQQKGVATDDKMMANMILAKSSQQNNQLDMASSYYKAVIALGKSEYAAEARYRIAEILLAQNNLEQAEKAAFEVVNKAGSYDYWITRAYILLGDVYFAQKDYFNAEATLKSVVDNSNNAELKAEAQAKLDKVRAEKNENSKIEQ